jgi:hypothetical protein
VDHHLVKKIDAGARGKTPDQDLVAALHHLPDFVGRRRRPQRGSTSVYISETWWGTSWGIALTRIFKAGIADKASGG